MDEYYALIHHPAYKAINDAREDLSLNLISIDELKRIQSACEANQQCQQIEEKLDENNARYTSLYSDFEESLKKAPDYKPLFRAIEKKLEAMPLEHWLDIAEKTRTLDRLENSAVRKISEGETSVLGLSADAWKFAIVLITYADEEQAPDEFLRNRREALRFMKDGSYKEAMEAQLSPVIKLPTDKELAPVNDFFVIKCETLLLVLLPKLFLPTRIP